MFHSRCPIVVWVPSVDQSPFQSELISGPNWYWSSQPSMATAPSFSIKIVPE